MKKTYAKLADLQALVGEELASSDWVTIDQKSFDLFVEATGDHQWIRGGQVRAAAEGPFEATVTPDFLTLSVLSAMAACAYGIADRRVGVNYALNNVRFPSPVPVGSRLRGHFKLLEYNPVEGGAQLTIDLSIEREGSDRPACVAESVSLHFV